MVRAREGGSEETVGAVRVRTGRRLRRLYRAAVVAATVGTCLFVLSVWLGKHTNIGRQSWRYVYGKPRRPFVYRVLVPEMVRTTARQFVDADTRTTLVRQVARRPLLKSFLTYLGVRKGFEAEYALIVAIQFVSLLGFAWMFRRLIRLLYDDDGPIVDLAVVTALVSAIAVYWRAGFVYDWPQLFLFTASLVALARYRWIAYYPLITLGFLNKETTCLIVLVFVAYAWDRLPRRRFLGHLSAQLALFYLLRALTVWMAGISKPPSDTDNALRDYLLDNVHRFWNWDLFHSVGTMASALLLVAIMARHYRHGPRFLQRAVILVPAFVAAFLKGGVWREIRVMGEVYPILFLLFYGGLLELAGKPMSVTLLQREGAPLSDTHPAAARLVMILGFLILGAFLAFAGGVGLYRVVTKAAGG